MIKHRLLNRCSILPAIALLMSSVSGLGAITAYWDCSSASPSSGSYNHVSIGAFSANNSGPTLIYTGSSALSDYDGASGHENFEARDPGSDPAVNGLSTYLTVTLAPDKGYSITLDSISLGSRSTTSGPTSIAIYSSLDDYAGEIGSGTSSIEGWSFQNISFAGDSLTSPAGAAVTLRIYGYGGVGSSSSYNWHVDDISFTGTLSAVPEPAAWGFASGFGLLVICGYDLWRNRRQSRATIGGTVPNA